MSKKEKKLLIINADDFGLTKGINRGIIHCFQNGIVRSVSLMANGIAFDDAVSLLKENGDLGVGWHAILVGEKPVLPASNIKSLVGADGKFFRDYKAFIFKYVIGQIHLDEILNELESQIVKILNSGIIIDHIDSHQFIHMLPKIVNIVIKLAKKYNIKYIRFPCRELFQVFNIKGIGLSSLSAISYLQVHNAGLNHTKRVLGFRRSCRMKENNLLECLDYCQDGVTEVLCHPGFIDETYRKNYAHWVVNDPEGEIPALTSEVVKKKLRYLNIELTNYRALYKTNMM